MEPGPPEAGRENRTEAVLPLLIKPVIQRCPFSFFLHLVSILICWEVAAYFFLPFLPLDLWGVTLWSKQRWGPQTLHSSVLSLMSVNGLMQTFVVLSFFLRFFLVAWKSLYLIVFLSCLIYFSFSLCSPASALCLFLVIIFAHIKTCFLVADTPSWSSWEMFFSQTSELTSHHKE